MTQLIKNGTVIDAANFQSLYPDTAFAKPINYAEMGWSVVFETPCPGENYTVSNPVLTHKGHYEQGWKLK